jgi:hypothetical protein
MSHTTSHYGRQQKLYHAASGKCNAGPGGLLGKCGCCIPGGFGFTQRKAAKTFLHKTLRRVTKQSLSRDVAQLLFEFELYMEDLQRDFEYYFDEDLWK